MIKETDQDYESNKSVNERVLKGNVPNDESELSPALSDPDDILPDESEAETISVSTPL